MNSCQICAEFRFYRSKTRTVLKAAQPFKRLSLDFKGSLPLKTLNKYMLTIIDKYSHFPFTIPCLYITAMIVIQALCFLFAVFGLLD